MTNNEGKKFHDTHPWKWIQLMKRVSPNYQRTVNTCWGPACKLIKQHTNLNFRIGVLKQFGTICRKSIYFLLKITPPYWGYRQLMPETQSLQWGGPWSSNWGGGTCYLPPGTAWTWQHDSLTASAWQPDSLSMTAWQPQHDSMTAWKPQHDSLSMTAWQPQHDSMTAWQHDSLSMTAWQHEHDSMTAWAWQHDSLSMTCCQPPGTA